MTGASSAHRGGRLVEFRLKLVLIDQLHMAIEEANGNLWALIYFLMNDHDILRHFGILLWAQVNERFLLKHFLLDVSRRELVKLLRPLALVIVGIHEAGQNELTKD